MDSLDQILLKNTELVVAKICHEFSNCLSQSVFMKEDILADRSFALTENFADLFRNVDSCVKLLCLVRSIFSTSEKKAGCLDAIQDLYSEKKIPLTGIDNRSFLDLIINGRTERLFSTILYILMKLAVKSSSVSIGVERNKSVTFSLCSTNLIIHSSIRKAISSDDFEEDVFNIIISHAKRLALAAEKVLKFSISANEFLLIVLDF
jgi:hypothetical protein